VVTWLQEAGLACRLTRSIAPPRRSGDLLTVSLWLAEDERIVTDWPLTQENREVA
jgi:ArsR family transcriptional regulator